MTTPDARFIADDFWKRLQTGDRQGVLDLLADEVDWFVPGDSALVPWAGQRTTKAEVEAFLGLLGGAMSPQENQVHQIIVDGPDAIVTGFFRHAVRATGNLFSSPYALHIRVQDGKVVRYHIYEDTQALVVALA